MPVDASFGRFGFLMRQMGLHGPPWEWRMPAIEGAPALIAFAQTIPGKILLFVAFSLLLPMLSNDSWRMTSGLAFVASLAGAVPRYRYLIAAAAGGGLLLFVLPSWYATGLETMILGQEGLDAMSGRWIRLASLLASVPLVVAVLWLAHRWRDHPVGQRPILVAHLVCFAMIGIACSHLLQGLPQVAVWSMTAVLASFLWYLCYALLDQRHRQPQPLIRHFAALHPFFAPWWIEPVGRGAASWRSVEALSAEKLAATQLSGLKLLMWAVVLKVALWLLRRIFYDWVGIPPLTQTFVTFLDSGVGPGPAGLPGILVNFPEQLLDFAIFGHRLVAVARLAGFRLLRNTYRPLSSRSIAEFWNHYDYYFKEALVNFYFYPTFLRCFKRHPRLRIAFATFMAAGVGNYLSHQVFRRLPDFAEQGVWQTLVQSQTYAFYCVLLSGGIILSQLLGRQPDPQGPWWRRQLLPSLRVMAFFCLLSFLDGPFPHAALDRHFKFLLNILGMD
jgi:hypothetical protein